MFVKGRPLDHVGLEGVVDFGDELEGERLPGSEVIRE